MTVPTLYENISRCFREHNEMTSLIEPQTHDAAMAIIQWHVERIQVIADTYGIDPYEWLADQLGVDVNEAEKIKVNPGERLEELREAQQPFFENFINEVRLSFDYYESQFEQSIERVALSGGSVPLTGLVSYLEEGLHLNMQQWDPIQKVKLGPELDAEKLKAWAPSLGVCTGLALRAL